MRLPRVLLGLLALALLSASPQESAERVRVTYALDAATHAESKVAVRMTVEGVRTDPARVAIPAWAPGAYRLVEYHKRISEVSAKAGHQELEVRSADPRTWSIATGGASPFTVSYTVTNRDSSRGGISGEHCDLQGPDTYMYVVGHKNAPYRVRFTLPEGWDVGTGLQRDGDTYFARDYDTFIDCPTELGDFDRHTFQHDGVEYEVVVHALGEIDDLALVEMCRKIVVEQERMFGGVPLKRYVFLFHFRNVFGGGGLEHLNSTSIAVPYFSMKRSVLRAANVTSHEFFHVWNVKRIRPRVLGPFDYTQPVRTKALWFGEGGTSYYGALTLTRCGIWSRGRYLRALEREIELLQNNPDRKVTSAEQASWTIWDPRQRERITYYNKGLLLSLLLDLRIRTLTRNRKSLDDVMRFLYEWFVVRGPGPIGAGYEETDIERAVSSVSGHDFGGFFRKYVAGLDELPYEEVLSHAGVRSRLVVRESPSLGVFLRGTRVVARLPGKKTPLRDRDRILEINGREVSRSDIRSTIRELEIGTRSSLLVHRGGEDLELTMKVVKKERIQATLQWTEEPDELQLRIRESWLTGDRDGTGTNQKDW